MKGPVVILGSGQAGFQVAASLRQDGFDGEIALVGDERGLPYQRPPLSKAYMKDGAAERLVYRNADFFGKNRIELADGMRAEAIDLAARQVALAGGRTIRYGHLVLATGARNRRPAIPGIDLEGVHGLRSLDDADAIRAALGKASRVAIIGGGFIGLEVGATAAALGRQVTVLEGTHRLMSRVVSEPVSAFFEERHAAAGIGIRLNAFASRIAGANGRVEAVETRDGTRIGADLVLVAAGVVPNAEIAEQAGLYVHDGVRVDDLLRTEDPDVSAIGDCASFPFGEDGVHIRLESVQNAVDQAKCLAAGLVGRPEPYARLPWFWSDQGPWKLQIAGLTAGADHHVVQRSDDRLTVFCFRRGELIGVETVNAPADHVASRKLLGGGAPVTLDRLAEAGFRLPDLVRAGVR